MSEYKSWLPDSEAPQVVIKSYFSKYDKDNSGALSAGEVCELCYDLGYSVTPAGAAQIVEAQAKNGKTITLQEFITWFQSNERMNQIKYAENLHAAIWYFKKYDTDRSGILTHAEYIKMCGDLKRPNPEHDIQRLDKDNDGKITFNEFVLLYSGTV